MAKHIIFDYTFDASAKTITLSDVYDEKRLLLITNVTDNVIIYNFADPDFGGTFEHTHNPNSTTITLAYDTTAMSDTDKLQIFYDADATTFRPSDEYLDPVSKIRVSNPENLIDTDFEYGLQSTKWETIELTHNIPTFFKRNGDQSIQLTSISTTNGSTLVKVVTAVDHDLLRGSPIFIEGTSSILSDGGFVVKNITASNEFTYEAKGAATFTGDIHDVYTQLFSAAIYDGTEFKLENTEGITTDGAAESLLTVTTKDPTNFKTGTKFSLNNSYGKATINIDSDNVTTANFTNTNLTVAKGPSYINPDKTAIGINTLQDYTWRPYADLGIVFDLDEITVNTTTNEITFPSHITFPDNYPIGTAQSTIDSYNANGWSNGGRQPLGFVYFSDPTNTPIGGMENGKCYWAWQTGERTIKVQKQKSTSGSYTVNLTSSGVSGGFKRERFLFGWTATYSYNAGTDYVYVYPDSAMIKAYGGTQGVTSGYNTHISGIYFVTMAENPDYTNPFPSSYGLDTANHPYFSPFHHANNTSSNYLLKSNTPYGSRYSIGSEDQVYFRYRTGSSWSGYNYYTINPLTANTNNDFVFLTRKDNPYPSYGRSFYYPNHGLENNQHVAYNLQKGELFMTNSATPVQSTSMTNAYAKFTLTDNYLTSVIKIDDDNFAMGTTYWTSNNIMSGDFSQPDSNGDFEIDVAGINQRKSSEFNSIEITGEALNDGDAVTYSKGDAANTVIGALTDNTTYYVANKTSESLSLSTDPNLYNGAVINIPSASSTGVVSPTTDTITNATLTGLVTGDAVEYKTTNTNTLYTIGGLMNNGIYFVRMLNSSTGEIQLHRTKADAIANTNKVNITRQSVTSSNQTLQKVNLIDLTSTPSNETHTLAADFVGAADGNYNLQTTASDGSTFTISNQSKIETRNLTVDSADCFIAEQNGFRIESHGFVTGQLINYTATGTTNISGLSNQAYYAIAVNRNIFQLAATKTDAENGTAITLTETGSSSSAITGSLNFNPADIIGRFDGSGTVSIDSNSKNLEGIGTSFTSFFQKGDIIYIAEEETTSTGDITSQSGTNVNISSISSSDTGKPIKITGSNLDENTIFYIRYQSSGVASIHHTKTDADANTNGISSIYNSSNTNTVTFFNTFGAWKELEIDTVNTDGGLVLVNTQAVGFADLKYALQTKLLLRPDGFALHRPYDGGVELIAPTNPDSQMVRQTRKYFRYQSGKGIQVSFAINFSPSTQIETYTRSGSTATITTRYPHRLTPDLQITTFGATNTAETLGTQIIDVTVQAVGSTGNNVYLFDGAYNGSLTLYEGRTYRFDLSDPTVSGHPFKLSTTQDGTHNASPGTEYTTGVTTSGTAGSTGAYLEITVASGAPTLYSYCSNHANMGSTHTTPTDADNNKGVLWNTQARVTSCPNSREATFILDGTPNDPSALGTPEYYVNNWTDCVLRCGLFDDQNGMFFEYDGSEISVNIRNSVKQLRGTAQVVFRDGKITGTNSAYSSQLSTGDMVVIKGQSYKVVNVESDSVFYVAPSYRGSNKSNVIISKTVNNRVPQSQWNIDKADGSGKTGFKLDIHKIQMAYIDYSWYGAGKVRFGFKDQNGNVKYVHSFVHGNVNTEAYMRSGNVPARYEILNSTAPTYTPALAHWGTSVIMDGKFDPDKAYLFNASSQNIVVTGESAATVTGRIETTNRYIERYWYFNNALGYGILLDGPDISAASYTAGTQVSGADLQSSTTLANPLVSTYASPYIQQVNCYIENEEGAKDAKNRTLLMINQAGSGTNASNSSYTIGAAGGDVSVSDEIPLISIRLAPSVDTSAPGFLGDREIINRMQLILNQVGILTTHAISVSLRLNGKLSTTAWQRVENPSLSQLIYHEVGDTITEGQSIYNFEAQGGTGTTGRSLVLTEQGLGDIATLGNAIVGGNNVYPDGPDVLTIVGTINEDISNITSNNPFILNARVSWSESQA